MRNHARAGCHAGMLPCWHASTQARTSAHVHTCTHARTHARTRAHTSKHANMQPRFLTRSLACSHDPIHARLLERTHARTTPHARTLAARTHRHSVLSPMCTIASDGLTCSAKGLVGTTSLTASNRDKTNVSGTDSLGRETEHKRQQLLVVATPEQVERSDELRLGIDRPLLHRTDSCDVGRLVD